MKIGLQSILALAIAGFGSQAMGHLVITGQSPQGVCTKDINDWGHPSLCECDSKDSYSPESHLCISKSVILPQFVSQGRISQSFTIGGETTGFVQEVAGIGTFELILKLKDKKLLEDSHKGYFEVEGRRINLSGVERKLRPAIIVDRLGILE